MKQVLRLSRVVQRIAMVSDFSAISEPAAALLARCARYAVTELYFVYDPLEETLPSGRRFAVSDGSTRVEFDAADVDLRAAYTSRFRARYEALALDARRYGMALVSVSTDQDLSAVGRLT